MASSEPTVEQIYDWKQLLLSAVVWVLVAALVVPVVGSWHGSMAAIRCLAVGGVVGLATVLAWLVAALMSSSDGIGPASTLSGMLVRLGVTVFAVVVLVSLARWDRQLVGFSAIAWHLPLLAVDSALMAKRLSGESAKTESVVDQVSAEIVGVEAL